MVGIEILEIIEAILKCSKNDHYLIDDFYYRIVSENEARDKKIDISSFKTVDIHTLALKYANKFSQLTNNECLIYSLSNNEFDSFLLELKKDDKTYGNFYSFLREDNGYMFEFCKSNCLPVHLNLDIFENYFNKKTSFENLLMNLSSLILNFKVDDVSIEADLLDFDHVSDLLEKLYESNKLKEFIFVYDLLTRDSIIYSNWLSSFSDKVKIAKFELKKNKLLMPGKKNKIEYVFNVFSFDRTILLMAQTEFKKYKQILNFEATDNPYGYAFSLDIFPVKKCHPYEEFVEFLKQNRDFFNRVRERTDKPITFKMVIRTYFYPQNYIEDININLEILELLSSFGIELEINNYFGD